MIEIKPECDEGHEDDGERDAERKCRHVAPVVDVWQRAEHQRDGYHQRYLGQHVLATQGDFPRLDKLRS